MSSNGPWYAHIRPWIDGVEIALVHYEGRGTIAQVVQPIQLDMAPKPEGTAAPASLTLDGDQARALYEALAAHFTGTAVMQTQRADYIHERDRVDKLIDHLTRMDLTRRGGPGA